MSYVICIPTRGRYHICNDKTLTTLAANRIPRERIHVYVSDAEEYTRYLETLDPALYGSLIIGRPGLVQQREYIETLWPPGQPIFYMDDDISQIDLSLTDCPTLDAFIRAAFAECIATGAHIWGIYPVYNSFFRKARPATPQHHLQYIVGCFYGIINRPTDPQLRLEITRENGQKEDVERTLLYYLKDSVVLRFDRVGVMTRYYGTVGGLGTFKERLAPMRAAAQTLYDTYPEFGRIRERKNGMCEFAFKRRRRRINLL